MQYELMADRENAHTKKVMTYPESLQRLKKAGYTRHLRPAEAFDLVVAGLDGRLCDPEQGAVFYDMVEGRFNIDDPYFDDHGQDGTCYSWRTDANGEQKRVIKIRGSPNPEWLSMAVERDGNKVTVYLDPKGLKLKQDDKRNSIYKKPLLGLGFGYGEKHTFRVSGYDEKESIILAEQLPQGLAKLVFGRPANELPKKLREKTFWRALLRLPDDGVISPVTMGTKKLGTQGFLDDLMSPCVIECSINGASRGLRE